MPRHSTSTAILWWIDHLGSGGSQVVLAQLIEHMSQRGARQCVICLSDETDAELIDRISLAGVEIHVIGKWRLLLGYGLLSAWKVTKDKSFTVSVTFLLGADVIGTLVAWAAKIPTRISAQRASNRNYSLLSRALVKASLTRATLIVLNSPAYQKYSTIFLPDRTPIHVIPNGLCTNQTLKLKKTNQLSAEIGVPDCIRFVGCVCRLAIQKRVEDVIRALALLKDETIHLLLVGDGPQKAYLLRVSQKLGLENRVHFLGHRHDVPDILVQLSLYVQASSYEGMSLSLMEAMAAACPVAVSAIEENLELVGNDSQGWSFEVGDIVELARIMTIVFADPDHAAARGHAAKEVILQNYLQDKPLRAWDAILENRQDNFG